MKAQKKERPDLDKPARTPDGHGNPQPKPAGKNLPDANVSKDGHCIVPAYAEATRADTGEPCEDGRDGE